MITIIIIICCRKCPLSLVANDDFQPSLLCNDRLLQEHARVFKSGFIIDYPEMTFSQAVLNPVHACFSTLQ